MKPEEDKLIAEGKMERPKRNRLSLQKYRGRAAKWHDAGAAGVHLFNIGLTETESILAAAAPWQK